jgi:transcriptional regulator with XRE-family HTH domain
MYTCPPRRTTGAKIVSGDPLSKGNLASKANLFSGGDTPVQTFGDRLKIYAKSRFGSMRAMAEVCGIDENTLSKYAKGARNPDFEQWEKLKKTGVNMHWLLTGEGEVDAPRAPARTGLSSDMGAVSKEQIDAAKKVFDQLFEEARKKADS